MNTEGFCPKVSKYGLLTYTFRPPPPKQNLAPPPMSGIVCSDHHLVAL